MEILIPIVIYVLLPIIGIIFFIYTNNKLKSNKQRELFTFKLFILFGCFGGLLLLLLTTLFWKWSGMASIGSILLFTIAPIFMFGIGYDSYKKKDDVSEKILFQSSFLYMIMLMLIIVAVFIIDK